MTDARQIRQLSVICILLVLVSSGCIGTFANLMHAANGNLIPAQFKGLKGRKVAVVCVSNSAAFGPTAASVDLARSVNRLLAKHVDKIKLIESQEIADWIDQNDWDYMDYVAIGRGVDAEYVLAIDLDSFSLHDGKTMYKGRADVRVVVHDLSEDGKVIFETPPTQVQFPVNSSLHISDISEPAFRRQFLNVLAGRIARHFYAYEVKENFAQDRSVISG